MRRFLLFLIIPLFFFLFANIQPASAVTCYTNIFDPSTAYEVQRTCTSNNDCADNEYCAYFGGCGGWSMGWVLSPCKPRDCTGCQVAENHKCVSQPRPATTPNCCSYSCIESVPGYSASLFDQQCYSLTNIQTDVNNCGYCGNKCTGGQVCDSGKCACPSDKPNWNPNTKQCEPKTICTAPSSYSNSNNCQSAGCTWCAPPAYSGYCAATSGDCKASCTYTGNPTKDDAACADTCETGGCNLRINVCTAGGTCGFSGTSKFCGIGNSCDKAVECYPSTGACGASGSGGSSWLYDGPLGRICSSGCPASYPNQQYVACGAISGCNPGTSGCGSYDPTQGQTPCCTAGGYQTCTKQEICKSGGCVNICTDPATDKNAEPYCSKCNSCQDGIQNCGEPSVDKCSTEPCTITTTTEYVKWSPSYCRDVCRNDGATCVAVQGTNGQYYPQGCAEGWTGNCKCSKTTTDFNPKTCSDGFQNCAETGKDCGGNCVTGKETDNSYLVTFDYTQPAGLSNTKLYSDAASWNCADGIDNDKDCLIDCADPDCASSYACTDKAPPVTTLSLSGKLANGWYASGTSATLSCQDDISGCKETYYCTDAANACAPSAKYSGAFSIGSSAFVRFYSNDKANNVEAVKSKEVKIDGIPPSVAVSAAPAAPCTLNPLASWIDCSATASVSCSDGESGCNPGTYMLKSYPSNPGSCPAAKSQYGSANSLLIKDDRWVCAYAEDAIGNAKASSPAEIKVNRTFAIAITARALSEMDVPAGSAVKAYLCDTSQYYCNHDAQYMATSSGTVGADKNFKITFALELDRGAKYKIGVVTEKGYAENEFIA